MDLLYFGLMSHLSHVKQMLSQPLHLTHEFILCTQIAIRRPDFTVKSPCWHRVLNLWPSNTNILWLAVVPSWQDLAIFIHGSTLLGPIQVASTILEQSPTSCQEQSPDFTPWKSLPLICLAYMLLLPSPALVFVSSTLSYQAASHPSTIQAQCFLTSVLEWELVIPTGHGPLTQS